MTAKLWHAALFLLENVPSDDPEFGGNIQGAQILLSEVLVFFLFPFYLEGAKFCRVILTVDRIMLFIGISMKRLIPHRQFPALLALGFQAYCLENQVLKYLAELYFFYIYI